MPQPETGTRQARLWRNQGTSFWIPGIEWHWPRSKDQENLTKSNWVPRNPPWTSQLSRAASFTRPLRTESLQQVVCVRRSSVPIFMCVSRLCIILYLLNFYLFNFVPLFWSFSCLVPCPILPYATLVVHGAYGAYPFRLCIHVLQRRLALAAVPAHATRARRTSRVTKGLPDKSNQRITQNLSKFKTARQNWKKTLDYIWPRLCLLCIKNNNKTREK